MYIYSSNEVLTPNRALTNSTSQYDRIPLTVYWRDERNVRQKHAEAAALLASKVRRFSDHVDPEELRRERSRRGSINAQASMAKRGKVGRKKKMTEYIRASFLSKVKTFDSESKAIPRKIPVEVMKARELFLAYLYAGHLAGRPISSKEVFLLFGARLETVGVKIQERTWDEAYFVEKNHSSIKVLNRSCPTGLNGTQLFVGCNVFNLTSGGVRLMESAYQNELYKPLIQHCITVCDLFTPIFRWAQDKSDRSPWPEALYKEVTTTVKRLNEQLPVLLNR